MMVQNIRRSPGRPPTLVSPAIIRVSLDGETRQRLRAAREQSGESESEIVRQAIEAELIRRGA